MRLIPAFATLLLTALLSAGAAAQQAPASQGFPGKPIRMIVPYPPGGAIDTMARKLGDELRRELGATVLVENRPGASTIIGTDAVAKAPADGYTLLFNAPAGIVQAPWLQERLPYDPIKDLMPIFLVAKVPTALIVPASLPVQNFAQFAAYAKSHGDKLSYASMGNGSTQHIFGELLNAKLRAGAAHVPYKGDAPAMNDLVPGRVHYMYNNVQTAATFSQQGKVKVLAVTGDSRLPTLPRVPTMSELGMPEFDLVGWYSVFAPAGTPRPIAERLHAAIAKATRSAEFGAYLKSVGLQAGNLSLDDFNKQINIEYVKWGRLIRDHQIKG
ncbi:MAG: Bug family tripartite tricarboxylate transporter substrate binding protein [Burkholderiaceae bacterium]